MQNLQKRLPNVSGLVAFEAAARHQSFTRAADELHVTQAAVSQQIKGLEEQLGTQLFYRKHRAIVLTAAGRRFQGVVAMALEHIAVAADELRQAGPENSVTVGVTHAVASFWLLPRMPKFRAAHPGIEVHVLATDVELEEVRDRIDAGIRYGKGRWPGFRAHRLSTTEVFPVCSPDYRLRRPALTRPEDLLDETLLSLEDARWNWIDWPAWFAEQGVKRPKGQPGLKVNSYPLLIQAARNAQGIALGWRFLIDDLLETGELIRALEASVETGQGFYLVTPEDAAPSSQANAFFEWVVDECREAL